MEGRLTSAKKKLAAARSRLRKEQFTRKNPEIIHLVQEFLGAAFHVLYSGDLHERTTDRIYNILLGGL